jgi:outer membrane protein assembly factor BamB
LWKLPLPGFVNNYGMASSPVLYENTLYLQCDQTHGSFVIAVDARTGRVRWRKERDKNVLEGWSTPLILAKSGELLAVGSSGLEAMDAATGQTRWSVPTGGGLMIPAPITAGVGNGEQAVIATFRGSDQPVYPSWEQMLRDDADNNGMLSRPEITKRFHVNDFGIADSDRDGFITQQEWNAFRNRGVGDFGITCIGLKDKKVQWRYTRGLPYVPSPVLYRNVLYWVRTGGILTAIDASTGRLLKEGRSPEALGDYFASPIAADGKLYLANTEGKVSVVRAAGADWEVLRVNDLQEPIAATPAIADNALFVRTHSKLYCFRAQ